MEKTRVSEKLLFINVLSCVLVSYVLADPVFLKLDNTSKENNKYNDLKHMDNLKSCKKTEFDIEDVIFLNNTDVFIVTKNITVHSSDYHVSDNKLHACLSEHNFDVNRLIAFCKKKFLYDRDEFQILPNRSALLFGHIILPEEYEIKHGRLLICAEEDDSENGFQKNDSSSLLSYNMQEASIYIGQAGSVISIVSLVIHLLTFCYIPSLRNLPGYNLASLSVAFLFSYLLVLIGQIPNVVGLSCFITAVLQQNFFLAAFFWMNVLAFDVWRTMKLATEKLIVGSNNTRKRQFLWYSLYAWSIPLLISTVSLLLDCLDGVPDKFKPFYARNDTCWMTNNYAKTIFFVVPIFTLIFVNGIFFIRSSMMISNNTMKCTNEQQKQSVKLNYILYLRLGIMMGVTWLLGVIALISSNEVMWTIQDIFNSLQGLFLFLLFTCTRKVVKHIKGKTSINTISSSDKRVSMSTSKLDSHPSF